MSTAKLFLLVSLVVPCFAQHPITAKMLLARISKDGAQTVVKQLNTPNEKEWEWVMDRVESGGDEWLDVADKLRSGTDAGTAEELSMVMARALVHNPNHVLRMTGNVWKVEDICADLEIEEPAAKMRKRIADVRLALQTVVAPELQEKKKACLSVATAGVDKR